METQKTDMQKRIENLVTGGIGFIDYGASGFEDSTELDLQIHLGELEARTDKPLTRDLARSMVGTLRAFKAYVDYDAYGTYPHFTFTGDIKTARDVDLVLKTYIANLQRSFPRSLGNVRMEQNNPISYLKRGELDRLSDFIDPLTSLLPFRGDILLIDPIIEKDRYVERSKLVKK